MLNLALYRVPILILDDIHLCSRIFQGLHNHEVKDLGKTNLFEERRVRINVHFFLGVGGLEG